MDTLDQFIGLSNNFSVRNGKVNIPLLYVHRYLRLTPVLAVAIFFIITLMRFLGSGPLWPSAMAELGQRCERYWWAALLYVHNYVRGETTVKKLYFDSMI